MVDKLEKASVASEKENIGKDQNVAPLLNNIKILSKMVSSEKGNDMMTKGTLLSFISDHLYILSDIDKQDKKSKMKSFEESLKKCIEDYLNRQEYIQDAVVVFKRSAFKIGTEGLYLYREDDIEESPERMATIIALNDMSGITDEINERLKFFPHFYVYVNKRPETQNKLLPKNKYLQDIGVLLAGKLTDAIFEFLLSKLKQFEIDTESAIGEIGDSVSTLDTKISIKQNINLYRERLRALLKSEK
jgi:hypothetical protein